jgi:hypothetical protein
VKGEAIQFIQLITDGNRVKQAGGRWRNQGKAFGGRKGLGFAPASRQKQNWWRIASHGWEMDCVGWIEWHAVEVVLQNWFLELGGR